MKSAENKLYSLNDFVFYGLTENTSHETTGNEVVRSCLSSSVARTIIESDLDKTSPEHLLGVGTGMNQTLPIFTWDGAWWNHPYISVGFTEEEKQKLLEEMLAKSAPREDIFSGTERDDKDSPSYGLPRAEESATFIQQSEPSPRNPIDVKSTNQHVNQEQDSGIEATTLKRTHSVASTKLRTCGGTKVRLLGRNRSNRKGQACKPHLNLEQCISSKRKIKK